MPLLNREELIARAIHNVQSQHSDSPQTDIAHLMSTPVFSSMPVEQKARVVAEYAKAVDREPEPTPGSKVLRLIGGTVGGVTGMAVPAAMYGALPWTIGELVRNKPMPEIASKLGTATRRAGPYLAALGAIGGLAGTMASMRRDAATRERSNAILDRIHNAQSNDEADGAAYELLAGSPHYLDVRDNSARISLNKRVATMGRMNSIFSGALSAAEEGGDAVAESTPKSDSGVTVAFDGMPLEDKLAQILANRKNQNPEG